MFRDRYDVDLQVERVSGVENPFSFKNRGAIQKGNAEKLTPPEIRAFFDYYESVIELFTHLSSTLRNGV